jgi:hypothetical protein
MSSVFVDLFILVALGIECRALHLLDKHCTICQAFCLSFVVQIESCFCLGWL